MAKKKTNDDLLIGGNYRSFDINALKNDGKKPPQTPPAGGSNESYAPALTDLSYQMFGQQADSDKEARLIGDPKQSKIDALNNTEVSGPTYWKYNKDGSLNINPQGPTDPVVVNANSGDTRWKDKAKEYLSQLQALQAQVNNPTDKWTPMLEQIYAQLSNVEYPTMPQFNGPEFQYDYRDDPAYQQYRQQYIRNGQLAMQDTMGQAAGLTGGYGSSYAQNVGQQAYQGYMNQLNAVVPQLYQNAYNRYADDYTRQYTEFKDRYSADVDRYNAERQNIKDQLNYTMQMADDDWKRRQQEFNNELALREESENNNRWWTQYAGNTGGSYDPETGLYTAPENTSSGLTFDQTMTLNKMKLDNPDAAFDENYNVIPPITYDGRTDTDLATEAVAYLQDNKKYKQVMKQYGNKELSQEDAEKYFMPVIEDVMKQLEKAGWTVTQRQYAREQFINALIYGGNQ